MKKILSSLLIIGVVASAAIGASVAYFSDTETSVGNKFTTGTIDIAVDGENPWQETFAWNDIKPGKDFEIEINIKNTGENPLKLWKIIKNVVVSENGIVDPEQEWYDEHNGGEPKNDIDSAIVYEMYVDGNLAIAKEAGITMSQIKDFHIGLVKLDQPFEPGNGDGILYPGETISITQRYFMKEGTENWAQTDKMAFDMEIEARQISAPEPFRQISFMDNKYPGWNATADKRTGVLKYDYMAPEFNYDFLGVGLNPAEEYCLIYAKDPWGAPKPLIDSGMADGNGMLSLLGSKDLGDLPSVDDENYPSGAKIWLLPCDDYTGNIGWPPQSDWLFDNWPGLINYKQGEKPVESNTVFLNNLGGDIENQYGYNHDYSSAAAGNVSFSYDIPQSGKLAGTIQASGLKPYATYQVKFEGKPTCNGGGNDLANEYIGYKGRWTCVSGIGTCTGNANARNRTDTQYEINKALPEGDPNKECIVGYLVFDYFTSDENGDIYADDIALLSNTSYHVLYCNSDGGVCNSDNSNTYLAYLDSNHEAGDPEPVLFCPYNKVNGQPEPGRGGCNGLALDSGNYDLKMILTEESFHQGNWASVLEGDIDFEIK